MDANKKSKKRTAGFDIIGITETWGRDSINDAGFSIEGFSMLYM